MLVAEWFEDGEVVVAQGGKPVGAGCCTEVRLEVPPLESEPETMELTKELLVSLC